MRYNVFVRLTNGPATLLKMTSFLPFADIFQRFRLLFRNTQLKKHLCMVASENITQTKAKIKKMFVFHFFLYRIMILYFSVYFFVWRSVATALEKKRTTSNLHFLIFIRNVNKSTNQTKRRIQNTAIYLRRKFLTSVVNHFEKELHLDEYASETV